MNFLYQNFKPKNTQRFRDSSHLEPVLLPRHRREFLRGRLTREQQSVRDDVTLNHAGVDQFLADSLSRNELNQRLRECKSISHSSLRSPTVSGRSPGPQTVSVVVVPKSILC